MPLPGEEYSHSYGRIRRVLTLLALAVILLTLLAVSSAIWRDYRSHRDLAQQNLQSRTFIAEERAHRLLDNAANALRQLGDSAEFRRCSTGDDAVCMRNLLVTTLARYPQFASIVLLDPQGKLIASSLVNGTFPSGFASEDFFLAHPKAEISKPFLGTRRLDPHSAIEGIPLSIAIRAEHRLSSVLLASLRPDFFSQALSELAPSPIFAGALFVDDGQILVQTNERLTAQKLWSGSIAKLPDAGVSLSSMIFLRKVADWPVGIALQGFDRGVTPIWLVGSLLILGIVLLAASLALLMFRRVLQLLTRQENTEADLYLTKVAVERGADMAIWLDRYSMIHYVNTATVHRLGYSEAEMLKMALADICPSFSEEQWPHFWRRLEDSRHLFDEVMLRTRSGEEFPAEAYSSFIVFKGRQYNCIVARDVSERRQAEEAARKREDELRLALAASSTGIFDMPLDGRSRASTSPEYDHLLGFEPGGLIETFTSWKEQLHPADRGLAMSAYLDYYIGKSTQFVVEYRRRHRNGEYRWFQSRGRFIDFDSQGRPIRMIGAVTDITERKQAEHRITELANLDAVTGLANRNLLRDELRAAIASAHRDKHCLAVLFLDLDRFKTINDSLGHAAGDAVLAQVAGRLRQNVGKTDILARLGGDEFVVVLTNIANPLQAGDVAERLLASFAAPFLLDAGEFAATTSIGISIFPDDTLDPETLIRHADVAMYQAKASGRNNYQFFTADMNARAAERLTLETGLRQSLGHNEFELMYQPQVSLIDGNVVGAEALLRWHHPELGLVPPSKFIPVAEESRIIIQIGNWVLQEACRQAADWVRQGLPPLTIAVNISPLQLHQANLIDLVQHALAESGLPPSCLELELTESVVMQEGEHVTGTLASLKRLGVRLSIDDFGTGYSSLSYLKRFDFDKLKIDQSFVHDIHHDPNDTAIVLAIIGLGKTLGMAVLAEGVETREQLEFMCAAEADSIQGFLFSRALSHTDFIALMQSQPRLALPGEQEIEAIQP